MSKHSSVYICQQCGYQSPSLLGKCPECGNWNSLVEQVVQNERKNSNKRGITKPNIIKLFDIDKSSYQRVSTKIDEFDRVLGGGMVLGSLVLVAGEPGIGKSTLLSHLGINIPNTLYVAGEESPQQIRLRIERINPKADLSFIADTDVDSIIAGIEAEKPSLVIVDSIQTLETTDLTAAAGSVSQVRESAHRLQKVAKKMHVPIFIVGHVTKEGTVAGPKTLEHLVDVVLSLEGDSSSNFRVLRANKNRFGPVDEVGIFEMNESGMKEVENPSEIFLQERVEEPGSTITVLLTGLRPILVEIQALVTKTNSPIPRRVGNGIDNNRLQLLVAVLQKRLKLPLWDQDVFVNVAGGIKINEPAADLAVCAAIISSIKDKALVKKAVFIGEVGLLGEVRSIRGLEKRIKEAKKLGFEKVFSPQNLKNLNGLFKKNS